MPPYWANVLLYSLLVAGFRLGLACFVIGDLATPYQVVFHSCSDPFALKSFLHSLLRLGGWMGWFPSLLVRDWIQ